MQITPNNSFRYVVKGFFIPKTFSENDTDPDNSYRATPKWEEAETEIKLCVKIQVSSGAPVNSSKMPSLYCE